MNYEKTTKSLGKVTKAVHQKLKEMAERGSHDAPSDAVCFVPIDCMTHKVSGCSSLQRKVIHASTCKTSQSTKSL